MLDAFPAFKLNQTCIKAIVTNFVKNLNASAAKHFAKNLDAYNGTTQIK